MSSQRIPKINLPGRVEIVTLEAKEAPSSFCKKKR